MTPVAPVWTQYSSGGEPQVLVASTVTLKAAFTNSGMQRCCRPCSSAHSSMAPRTHTAASQLHATRARIRFCILPARSVLPIGRKTPVGALPKLSQSFPRQFPAGTIPDWRTWKTRSVWLLRLPGVLLLLSGCPRSLSALCVRRHAPTTPAGKDGSPDYTQSTTAQLRGAQAAEKSPPLPPESPNHRRAAAHPQSLRKLKHSAHFSKSGLRRITCLIFRSELKLLLLGKTPRFRKTGGGIPGDKLVFDKHKTDPGADLDPPGINFPHWRSSGLKSWRTETPSGQMKHCTDFMLFHNIQDMDHPSIHPSSPEQVSSPSQRIWIKYS